MWLRPREISLDEEIQQSGDREQKRIEKNRPRRITASILLGVTALTSILYATDVAKNEQLQNEASISIEVKGDPANESTEGSALVFINGFGTYDADILAKYIGPVIQQVIDGELWSLSYGNAPLSEEAIAEEIKQLAKQRNIDRVTVIGYSAGGIIGIHTVEELYENSNLIVEAIVPISTPDGIEGLRPARKDEIAVAQLAEDVPGASHSTAVRFGGEMYFRRDRYDEGDPLKRVQDFMSTAGQVIEDLDDEKMPSTPLLIDVTVAISNAQLEEALMNIGSYDSKKQRPIVWYLGTAKPGRDYMVDDKLSSKNICAYSEKANLECFTGFVPGAVHTMPNLANEEYMATVAEMGPLVDAAITRAQQMYSMANLAIRTPIYH